MKFFKNATFIGATNCSTLLCARWSVFFSTVLTGTVGAHDTIFFHSSVGARGVISEMRWMYTL